MSIEDYPQKLRQLVEEFLALEPELRTEMLIELGEGFVPVPESIAEKPYPDSHKVPACESEAYLFTEDLADGRQNYHFAIENPQGISAMAIASIIAETISGEPLSEVAKLNENVIYDFFGRGISMGKGQGLMAMIQMVRAAAKKKLAAS